jgi:ABC-2 type transport system ATP-binding protein
MGTAILVTTHYMSEAEHCDQLALMYAGRLAASGSPAQMKHSVQESIGRVVEIDASDARRAAHLLRQQGFPGAALYGAHIHLFSKEPQATVIRVREQLRQAGMELRAVHERPVTMEDVFVSHVTALELEQQKMLSGTPETAADSHARS